jgi:hypothetical protein
MANHFSLVTSRQRVGVNEAFGEPNHSQLEAFCDTERRSGSVSDFDAAASNVHNYCRRACNIDAVDGCEMNQPGFFRPRNDPRLDSRGPFDGSEKFPTVFRFSDRAGGRRENFLYLMGFGEPAESGKSLKGSAHGLPSQRLAVESARPEPHHLLLPIDHFKGEIGPDPHDDHVNRVCTAVDCCYPHLFEWKRVVRVIESSYNGRRNGRRCATRPRILA